MSRPSRIPSLDGGGIMGAFAASALATVVRRRIGGSWTTIESPKCGGPTEADRFLPRSFRLPLIATCTLAEAHSRPGLVTVEASRLSGRFRTHGIQQLLQGSKVRR